MGDKAREETIEIWADTRHTGKCRGCIATIQWAQVVASGADLPFNDDGFVVVSTRTEGDRLVERVYRANNHWATCPGRDLFTKSSRRGNR